MTPPGEARSWVWMAPWNSSLSVPEPSSSLPGSLSQTSADTGAEDSARMRPETTASDRRQLEGFCIDLSLLLNGKFGAGARMLVPSRGPLHLSSPIIGTLDRSYVVPWTGEVYPAAEMRRRRAARNHRRRARR